MLQNKSTMNWVKRRSNITASLFVVPVGVPHLHCFRNITHSSRIHPHKSSHLRDDSLCVFKSVKQIKNWIDACPINDFIYSDKLTELFVILLVKFFNFSIFPRQNLLQWWFFDQVMSSVSLYTWQAAARQGKVLCSRPGSHCPSTVFPSDWCIWTSSWQCWSPQIFQ